MSEKITECIREIEDAITKTKRLAELLRLLQELDPEEIEQRLKEIDFSEYGPDQLNLPFKD